MLLCSLVLSLEHINLLPARPWEALKSLLLGGILCKQVLLRAVRYQQAWVLLQGTLLSCQVLGCFCTGVNYFH